MRSGAAPRARAAARAPRPRHRPRPPHLPAVSRLSVMPPPLPAPPSPVRERMTTRSGAWPRTAPAAVAPPGPSCYGAETMRAPSSGQSRAFRAPRGRGRYRVCSRVCSRPSSFGPGPGPAANGCATTGAQTPALPPLGPWRRIALRARTSWGLVPVVTAAAACSPRTSSRTSSAHTVHSKKRPAPSGCGDGGPSG